MAVRAWKLLLWKNCYFGYKDFSRHLTQKRASQIAGHKQPQESTASTRATASTGRMSSTKVTSRTRMMTEKKDSGSVNYRQTLNTQTETANLSEAKQTIVKLPTDGMAKNTTNKRKARKKSKLGGKEAKPMQVVHKQTNK